jgi:lysophospholipase L1-like esterase
MASQIDQVNAAISHLANSTGVVMIDIHTPLSTAAGIYASQYTSDGLHFSVLGSAVVASTVHSRVSRYGY